MQEKNVRKKVEKKRKENVQEKSVWKEERERMYKRLVCKNSIYEWKKESE